MALQTKIIIKATATKAMKTMLAFGGVLKKITFSVVSMRSALVAIGGAAGFGYLVKSSLNATDSLAKTAAKIGTTTDALSKLQYAASITGVEQNTLNMAMQRFTRRTAEAAKGTGEAKGAIRELGLDAKQLQKLPLDQKMMVLADAFANVDSKADKLRIAFKLFDSEGAALVNTLALGADGMSQLFDKAELLGIVMSQDAATGAEAANDALSDLFSVVRGLKDQFSAALAPAITTAVNTFTNFIIRTADASGGIQKLAQTMAIDFLNGVKGALGALDRFATGLDKVIAKAHKFFTEFETRALQKEMKDVAKEMSRLGAQINHLEDGGIPSVWQYITDGGLAAQKNDIQDLGAKYVQLFNDLKAAQQGTEDFGTSLGDIIDMEGVNDFFADITADIGKMGKTAPAALTDLVDTTTLLGQAFDSTKDSYQSWIDEIPTMEDNIKSLTHQALDGLTDSLANAVTGAANFKDSMKAMSKSVVDSLIKMLIQKYIVDAAFGAITGFIGNRAAETSGTVATLPTGFGTRMGGGGASMAGANAGNFGHRAIGGSVQAGQPYMVGERGQEMFVPNQSGSIIPNNQLGGGSGVVVNQTINISTGVAQTVRAEVAGMMPQIAAAAKGAVADARQRGGGYSQALIGA